MTSKDYARIAADFKALRATNNNLTWQQAVELIAEHLSEDNPRFDCGKFYRACGYWE